ncbi:acetyl-CoA hydrolase/transferase family protein [Desulfatitalea tepidiphila]|uniref:acetyl-CoA hydrolase/transferase family protein n=1 Tax=Desulfatitalea tepidiphila TaxID=1185843 RepID=UPI0006B601D8|nr:acetyl-CoA hydrolase/transferase C-terminal domain-containing protein [Desulfatitalea tepidiphila]
MENARLAEEYQRKLISAEAAAGLVQSGMSIFLGISANMAHIVDKHLARRKDELRDVNVQTSLDTSEHEFLKADPEGKVFKWHSGFFLHSVRNQVAARGCGVYWAQSWHLAPGVIREQSQKDISFIVTAPMDAHGYFNFGLSVTELQAFCEVSKKIVVVVKEDMPVVCGGQEEAIHISKVDHIVEDREFKTFCLPTVPVKEEDRMIAHNIVSAGLIGDGTTLQIGIGGLPNSVLDALVDAGVHHLGIHSEMLTDKMYDLIEAGVVDNTRKKVDRYKSTFSFCLGSRRLYDFLDRNPMFASYPVDYVNNPLIIAQQPRMFSLNTTMQVDLMGQVASEQVGGERPRQISGTGGQLDFVMGTMLSHDRAGVSVLALYSQYKGRSRIVPILEKGTNVTVPRSLVDYVATEWGLVRSRGLSINERAQALIRIAHPDHREALMRQAVDAGFVPYRHTAGDKLPRGVINCRD